MKLNTQFKSLALLILFAVNAQVLSAQSRADVFNPNVPLTLLGLDYSQTKYIGAHENTSVGFSAFTVVRKEDNGLVTDDQFRDEFTVAWNELFLDEPKKYNVAKATNRSEVNYALDVAEKANKTLKKEFFGDDPSVFKTIDESTITSLVKNYDFGKNKGLGLIFFVEGMSRGLEKEGVWVTFVDMNTKTVLLTKYVTEKPGGGGFRNYWAKPIFMILKNMESDFKRWQ